MIKETFNWIKEKFWLIFGLVFIGVAFANMTSAEYITNIQLQEEFLTSNIEYQINGSKLKKNLVGNKKNKVEVEIGDDLYFEPKMKIKRWNEVNLALKLVDTETGTPDLNFDSGKINFLKGNKEISMYELEGGYEFEITLKEKPTTNIIQFEIEAMGLDFYYQAPLNEEMSSTTCTATDCGGFHRPENVVGSYAIYMSQKRRNTSISKEYKSNKFGHLYRPKIIDSDSEWVWGELSIENNILTVTIPQSFLDTATYPIHHATGLTFGYTSIGGSSGGVGTNFIFAHQRVSPASDGLADSISVYLVSVVEGSKSTAGLYLAPTLYPTDLVGGTADYTNVDSSWNVLNLSQEAVTTGTDYRIGVQIGVAGARIKYDTGSGENDYYKSRAYTAGAMPDPFPASANSENNLIWSTYVTYHETAQEMTTYE